MVQERFLDFQYKAASYGVPEGRNSHPFQARPESCTEESRMRSGGTIIWGFEFQWNVFKPSCSFSVDLLHQMSGNISGCGIKTDSEEDFHEILKKEGRGVFEQPSLYPLISRIPGVYLSTALQIRLGK